MKILRGNMVVIEFFFSCERNSEVNEVSTENQSRMFV